MANIKDIMPDELARFLSRKNFVLVDVQDCAEEYIPGTDETIPCGEIKNNLSELPGDKSAKIVVYCRVGKTSRLAAKILSDLGYLNVYNLSGGINEWKNSGYRVQRA